MPRLRDKDRDLAEKIERRKVMLKNIKNYLHECWDFYEKAASADPYFRFF